MENMNFNPYQNVAMPRQPSTGTSGSSTTSSMSPTNQYVVQPRTVQLPPGILFYCLIKFCKIFIIKNL